MTGSIPEQHPVGDVFVGSIIQCDNVQLLATKSVPDCQAVADGDFVVRYGLRFQGKLHVSIVPGLVVMDYGDMLTGEEAWDFLIHRSNQYPRSEVVGYRNDGRDDMVFIRSLDMAVAPEVLVYPDFTATQPLYHPAALIAPVTDAIASRLLKYLPHYVDLSAWQAESNT